MEISRRTAFASFLGAFALTASGAYFLGNYFAKVEEKPEIPKIAFSTNLSGDVDYVFKNQQRFVYVAGENSNQELFSHKKGIADRIRQEGIECLFLEGFNGKVDSALLKKADSDMKAEEELVRMAGSGRIYFKDGVSIENARIFIPSIDIPDYSAVPGVVNSINLFTDLKIPFYGCENMHFYQSHLFLRFAHRLFTIVDELEKDKNAVEEKKEPCAFSEPQLRNYFLIKQALEERAGELLVKSGFETFSLEDLRKLYFEADKKLSLVMDRVYAESAVQIMEEAGFNKALVLRSARHVKNLQELLAKQGFECVYQRNTI